MLSVHDLEDNAAAAEVDLSSIVGAFNWVSDTQFFENTSNAFSLWYLQKLYILCNSILLLSNFHLISNQSSCRMYLMHISTNEETDNR